MRLPTDLNPRVEETFTFVIPDDASISPVQAVLTLEPVSAAAASIPLARHLRLEGKLFFTVEAECARCLKKTRKTVRSSFTSLLDLQDFTVAAADLETPPEEDGFTLVGEGEIDLTRELIQRVQLAVPELVYCLPDCKGLCSVCGADLNRGDCGCGGKGRGGPFEALRTLLDDPKPSH